MLSGTVPNSQLGGIHSLFSGRLIQAELVYDCGGDKPLLGQVSRPLLKLWALLRYLQKQQRAILTMAYDLHAAPK